MQPIVFKNKQEILDRFVLPTDTVLDVGFWGQGTTIDDPGWIHGYLLKKAAVVYGVDLIFDATRLQHPEQYQLAGAENFSFPVQFDVIYAGDLIEHIQNPGLFLDNCKKHLKSGGKLIINTPNCYSLENLAGKLMQKEPVVNDDHVCYYNEKTFRQLCKKNKNWQVEQVHYLYALPIHYRQSIKKRLLNIFYALLAKCTNKYLDCFVFVLKENKENA